VMFNETTLTAAAAMYGCTSSSPAHTCLDAAEEYYTDVHIVCSRYKIGCCYMHVCIVQD
jgi:hypothetical protein